MNPVETWASIDGFDGRYEVSDHGRVRRLRYTVHKSDGTTQTYPARVLQLHPHPHGYSVVSLGYMGKTVKRLLHRLLAQAFIPNPDGLPVVRHLNDITTDNRLENLAWGTQSDNMQDSVRNGNNPKAARTECPRGHEYTVFATRRKCMVCFNTPVECPDCGASMHRGDRARHRRTRHAARLLKDN